MATNDYTTQQVPGGWGVSVGPGALTGGIDYTVGSQQPYITTTTDNTGTMWLDEAGDAQVSAPGLRVDKECIKEAIRELFEEQREKDPGFGQWLVNKYGGK